MLYLELVPSHLLATGARRVRLLGLVGVLGLGWTPRATAHPPSTTELRLHHVHQQRSLTVQLLDEQGRVRRAALRDLRKFLACHKTGANHPIHWRLASMLLSISTHWPTRTIVVHSGYRDPRVSHHAKRSNHTRGRAIDIRIPGVSNRALFSALRRSFRNIGLGYYPNSSFVHLDVRDKSAIWVDYAGPGQAACYSRTPERDLRTGRAERTSYAQAKERGCR